MFDLKQDFTKIEELKSNGDKKEEDEVNLPVKNNDDDLPDKVAAWFLKCDENNDGVLTQEEAYAYIKEWILEEYGFVVEGVGGDMV